MLTVCYKDEMEDMLSSYLEGKCNLFKVPNDPLQLPGTETSPNTEAHPSASIANATPSIVNTITFYSVRPKMNAAPISQPVFDTPGPLLAPLSKGKSNGKCVK